MLPKRLEDIRIFLRLKHQRSQEQNELLYELEKLSNLLDIIDSNRNYSMESLKESVRTFKSVTSAWGSSPDSCPTCGK